MSRNRLYARARKRTSPKADKEPTVPRIANNTTASTAETPAGGRKTERAKPVRGLRRRTDEGTATGTAPQTGAPSAQKRRAVPAAAEPGTSRKRRTPAADPYRDMPTASARSWYQIRNSAVADTAVVHIYNDIGGEPGGLTAKAFERDLSNVDAKRIDLRINSRGGDVFDGIAIHNALRQHPAQVHVTVDGVAASIASVIAMAGDKVTMARGSQMMIHEGFTAMVGNSSDMTKAAALLDKTSDTIASFYAERAGGTVADWRNRMRQETWYSAEEAVAAGLADELAPGARAMRNRIDLSVFNYAGRSAAPAPAITRAPASVSSPKDSWADITGSLTAPSISDSVLATLLEDR